MASKRERQEHKLQKARDRKEQLRQQRLQEEELHKIETAQRQQRLEEFRNKQLEEIKQSERQRFPTFAFINEQGADPQFVQRVKEITAAFDFNSLPDILRDWYARIKADPQFLIKFSEYEGGSHPTVLAYMFHMGEYIYHSLGSDAPRWIPFNDLRVIPTGKRLLIKFGGLKRDRGQGGTVYYSSLEPKIKFANKEYIVGYSTHSIEQTLARLVGRSYSYAGAGDAFGFFNNCIHYEPVTLLDGKPAFTFYDECRKGFLNWHYANAVYGNKIKDNKIYYRRVGYCPVVFEGRYAKAKTLLSPGYSATPETIGLNKLHKQLREDYRVIINSPIGSLIDNKGVARIPSNYFDPTKYLHQFIPQVIESDKEYYERVKI